LAKHVDFKSRPAIELTAQEPRGIGRVRNELIPAVRWNFGLYISWISCYNNKDFAVNVHATPGATKNEST